MRAPENAVDGWNGFHQQGLKGPVKHLPCAGRTRDGQQRAGHLPARAREISAGLACQGPAVFNRRLRAREAPASVAGALRLPWAFRRRLETAAPWGNAAQVCEMRM